MSNLTEYQTSEKIKIKYEIADIPIRLGAYLLDMVFQYAVYVVFYIFALILLMMAGQQNFNDKLNKIYIAFLLILLAIAFIFTFCYRLIFEIIWKGQTPGKRILKLRAIHDDGTSITPMSAILRNLFRIIDSLPFGYVVGMITMSVNKKRKRIGDLVAGTIVIKENKIELSKIAEPIKLDCFANIDINKILTKEESDIIKNYCDSRPELDKNVRMAVEDKIVDLIERKTNIKKPEDVNKDTFIDAIYYLI